MTGLTECAQKVLKAIYKCYDSNKSNGLDYEDSIYIDGYFWTKDEELANQNLSYINNALNELRSKGYISDDIDITGSFNVIPR